MLLEDDDDAACESLDDGADGGEQSRAVEGAAEPDVAGIKSSCGTSAEAVAGGSGSSASVDARSSAASWATLPSDG